MWNIDGTQGKTEISEVKPVLVPLFAKIPKMINLRLNVGFRGEKPPTKRLSHDTDLELF
jgi:hypothetical protein